METPPRIAVYAGSMNVPAFNRLDAWRVCAWRFQGELLYLGHAGCLWSGSMQRAPVIAVSVCPAVAAHLSGDSPF